MTRSADLGPGCCPGCQDCFGSGRHCHQEPCRCQFPCTCNHDEDEDADPFEYMHCARHDDAEDTRFADRNDEEPDLLLDAEALGPEARQAIEALNASCPVCGALGACAYDREGLPMIHAFTGEDEESDAIHN